MSKTKIAASVLIAVIVIGAGFVFLSSGHSNSNSENTITAQATGSAVDIKEISLQDEFSKGDPNAPVTITEYGDYQCPFCKRFHDTVLPQLEKEYIETGKAKYVFKDFPLNVHTYAQKASEASYCAAEQGKYWEMHDKIFENQNSLGLGSLKNYAKELGLNSEEFNKCLDSGKYADKVHANAREGSSIGITGTPGFSVNGQVFSGVLPISSWRQLIENV